MSLPGPRFHYKVCIDDPVARVSCLECGWHVGGPDPNVVFPLADGHTCRTTVARSDDELVGALSAGSALPLGLIDDDVNRRRHEVAR